MFLGVLAAPHSTRDRRGHVPYRIGPSRAIQPLRRAVERRQLALGESPESVEVAETAVGESDEDVVPVELAS